MGIVVEKLWRIELMGGLRARRGEVCLTHFSTRKTASLLAYCAFYIHQRHPRELLVEMLWPDSDLPAGLQSLSQAISSLRRQLEPPGIPRGSVVLADRTHVGLNPQTVDTDTAQFEQALRLAAGSPRGSVRWRELLQEAVDLYGGELLPGYYEEWIPAESLRLADLFQAAVHRLITGRASGDAETLSLAHRASAVNPLNEDLKRDLEDLRAGAMEPPLAAPAEGRQSPEVGPATSRTFLALDTTVRLELLQEAVLQRYGQVLEPDSEGFLAVFGSAAGAMDCAVALQQLGHGDEIQAALWTAETAGAPGRESPAARQAFHLLRAAHPGQIVCAEATASLVRQQLPDDIGLVPLGAYRLGGSVHAALVFDLRTPAAAGKRRAPLNAPAGSEGSVPFAPTELLGREAELSLLQQLLVEPLFLNDEGDASGAPCRLVTLTGPGGIGKSRLALELAHRFSRIGSAWFVPLTDVAEPGRILDAIQSTLRLPMSAEIDPLEQVIHSLSGRPTLLILDNLEHLLSAPGVETTPFDSQAEDVVRTLLQRVPSLRCLATSRQLLGLEAERELPVPPLPVPPLPASGMESVPAALVRNESVQLFLRRAQIVRPDFQMTDRNAGSITLLCRRLEGIPLALELAAARVHLLSAAQILSQLERRFEFLISRRKEVHPRHRTLRSAIEWSFHLLAPPYRRAFASLSVFRGGWTLEAADAIGLSEVEGGALEALSVLRESSLIQVEEAGPETRCRMLETLREYAAEQVPAEIAEDLRQRHARYFLDLAQRAAAAFQGIDELIWLRRLDAEHENLRAALEWSLDQSPATAAGLAAVLWPFWATRGYFSEGRKWLLRAFRAAGTRSPLRAELLLGGGALALSQSDYQTASTLLEESLSLFQKDQDHRGVGAALRFHGVLAWHREQKELARYYLQRSLALCRKEGDRYGTASALQLLGNVSGGPGECAPARRCYEESLALAKELGCREVIARSLNCLGVLAYGGEEDLDKARRLFEESLAIYRELENKPGIGHLLSNLSSMVLAQGDQPMAFALLRESLALQQEMGSLRGLVNTMEACADAAMVRGDAAGALTLVAACTRIRAAIDAPLADYLQHAMDQTLKELRTKLGDQGYATAWRSGQALSDREAVDLARRLVAA